MEERKSLQALPALGGQEGTTTRRHHNLGEMEQRPERHKPPKLTQEQTDNLTGPH